MQALQDMQLQNGEAEPWLNAEEEGEEGEEEEYDQEASTSGGGSGSEAEEDRQQFGIYQALPVEGGEPDWEAGEPASAEEYLRRVRWAWAAAQRAARCG